MATATEVMDAPRERWAPGVGGWVARLLILVGILGGVLYLTAVLPGYWADRVALAAIWAMIGLSLNVVLGYVGQVSLGHHAFVGIAAFVAAFFVTERAGCTIDKCSFGQFSTAVVLAALSGALAAGLLGLVALRIRGLYLALITLAYGFVAERSIFEIPSLTRGGAGMPATRPDGWSTDTQFAFLCFIFLALVIYLDWRFLRSKVGRAVLAIRHSEPVASSYGVNVTAYKVLAFTMSGLFAGIAGGLFAFHAENVVSNNFSFANATLWVLMVVVGGLGNRVGVIIGSAFFALFPFLIELIKPLEDWVVHDLGRALGNVTITVGAALALVTMISYPGGIGEQISPITRWLGGKKFSLHPEGHGGHGKHKEKETKGAKAEPAPSGGLMAKLGLHKEAGDADKTEELAAWQRAVEHPVSDTRRPETDGGTPDVWGALTGKREDT